MSTVPGGGGSDVAGLRSHVGSVPCNSPVERDTGYNVDGLSDGCDCMTMDMLVGIRFQVVGCARRALELLFAARHPAWNMSIDMSERPVMLKVIGRFVSTSGGPTWCQRHVTHTIEGPARREVS